MQFNETLQWLIYYDITEATIICNFPLYAINNFSAEKLFNFKNLICDGKCMHDVYLKEKNK